MTNSCYDISYINEKASVGEIYAKIRCFEGSFQDVTDEGITTKQFIREKLLSEPEILFDYFRPDQTNFHEVCRAVLSDYSKLPIIKEQDGV